MSETEQIVGPLSWRDVYRAVGESEARVIIAIGQAVTPLTDSVRDHGKRLDAVEDSQVSMKASVDTARAFFAFGRWVLATVIAVCGVAIAAIAVLGENA